MAKKTARNGKKTSSVEGAKTVKSAKKKLPRTKGRFYEDPQLVRSKRDPNFRKD